LKDLGYVSAEEPFKKLINQGHIQGNSMYVYRLFQSGESIGNVPVTEQTDLTKFPAVFISKNLKDKIEKNETSEDSIKRVVNELNRRENTTIEKGIVNYDIDRAQELRIDISLVDSNGILNIEQFKKWRDNFFSYSEFIYDNGYSSLFGESGNYICGSAVEKMSKSYFNVVNPDDIIASYGADTLRLYEMFLGPLELSKPWNTNGIDGVFKFLRKFWNLYHDAQGNWNVSDAEPSRDELKILHKTIKKVEQDINNFSFNTTVSEFMICVNELSAIKCNKRAVLEPLAIILSPYAPHLAEELWEKLGYPNSILHAKFPAWNEEYLKESSFEYPISINGKVRTKMEFALDMPKEDIEKVVLASELVNKWTEGKPPKKVIVVPGKIVNVVI
jgi:leucyl-tRNA synthetase